MLHPEGSGGKTDQRAKRLVRQLQFRADPSPDKSEGIGRDDLPESNVIIHYFVLAESLRRHRDQRPAPLAPGSCSKT